MQSIGLQGQRMKGFTKELAGHVLAHMPVSGPGEKLFAFAQFVSQAPQEACSTAVHSS